MPLERKSEIQRIRTRIKDKINNEPNVYISSYWIYKWSNLVEPGPISNSEVLCQHKRLRLGIYDKRDKVVQAIPQSAWNELHRIYQGGPPLGQECLTKCRDCEVYQVQL
jgi:hypothetical protein